MTLRRAEFMPPPGGGLTPIGAVKAGPGINISPTTGSMSLGGGMPTGTRMFFLQETAPEGWTKMTAEDDIAIRITSGSGGSASGTNPFTTAFASYTPEGTASSFSGFTVSGSTTGSSVAESQMGSHRHGYASPVASSSTALGPGPLGIPVACSNQTNTTGGGGQHSHSLTGSLSGEVLSFTGTLTNQFVVQYVDLLLCEKD